MGGASDEMNKPRHNSHRYTPKRVELALEGYREHGSDRKAAEAAGVTHQVLGQWRRKYPDFAAKVAEAIDECARRDGQLAVSVIRQHLEDSLERKRVRQQAIDQKRGKVVELEMPGPVNPTLVKMALTRYDKRFTHPPQEVEHSGSLTVEQAVAEAAARLDDSS